jgi:hypothetical protein
MRKVLKTKERLHTEEEERKSTKNYERRIRQLKNTVKQRSNTVN